MTKLIVSQYKDRMDTPYNDGALITSDAEKWATYALFLSQKLELWMFVPCKLVDGVWLVLEEPVLVDRYCKKETCNKRCEFDCEEELLKLKEYQEAKERVLFEGNFQVKSEGNPFVRLNNIEFHLSGLTVERLVTFELILTESAKKQLSL